jgi:hypothetical protein
MPQPFWRSRFFRLASLFLVPGLVVGLYLSRGLWANAQAAKPLQETVADKSLEELLAACKSEDEKLTTPPKYFGLLEYRSHTRAM